MSKDIKEMDTTITKTTFKEILNYYAPDVFKDPTFGELTCYKDNNNQYWFIGSEVCFKLGYSNPWKAVRDLIPSNYKMEVPNDSFGSSGGRPTILINELGLYCLAIKSRMPGALRFQEWGRHFIHDMLDQHGFVIGDNQHNQEIAKLQLDDSMLEDKDIKD